MQAHNANDTFTGSATFLHSSPKSVPILYNDPSFPSLKMPLVMGDMGATDDDVAVASAEPDSNHLHLAPDR